MILETLKVFITEKQKEVKKTKKTNEIPFAIRINNKAAAIGLIMFLAANMPLLSIQGDETGRRTNAGFQDIELGEYILFGHSDHYDVSFSVTEPKGRIYYDIDYQIDEIVNDLDKFYKYVVKARKDYQGNEMGIPTGKMLAADKAIKSFIKEQQKPTPPKRKQEVKVTPDYIYIEGVGYVDKYHNDNITVKLTTTETYSLGQVNNCGYSIYTI